VLRVSEDKFRTLLEASRDAVFVLDQDKYLYVNQTAVKLLGFNDSSELIGRDAFEFIAPEDREKARELAVRRQRGEDVPSLYEFSVVNKEGSKITVEANVSLIEFEGKPASLSMNRDISERRRTEEELQGSEERWRSLVELAPDGIMTVNLKGEITWVNEGFLRLTGLAREEIIGKHFSKLNTIQARDIPKYLKMFAQALRGRIHALVEFSYAHRDGSIRWAEGHFTFVNVGGNREVLGYLKDVTKYKVLEARLRDHSVMLEKEVVEKSRAILDAERMVTAGKIAASVGHDLRGPLQSIKNAVYLLRNTPDSLYDLLEVIDDSVDRATLMLQEFRDQTREDPLFVVDVDLGELLGKALEEAGVPEGVNASAEVDGGVNMVSLDVFKIRRVLDNLIRNAVEAMPKGGELKVHGSRGEAGIIIVVSDTGEGIRDEVLEDLFKPFHTTKPGGLGLGLAYCKRAVEAHGGVITVESEVGKGTSFTVRLP